MEKKDWRRIISMLLCGICVFIVFGPFTVRAQSISPVLVGSNVWINPQDAQWTATGSVGVQIMRIGGHAYDKRMPSDSQLIAWIAQIKKIGAEPLIQVSQYGDDPATEAARLVKLFNVDKPENYVKYWGIGNEPWLQAGRPPLDSITEVIEKYLKKIAPAMKAVDPTIKIFGPDMCDFKHPVYESLFGGSRDIAGKIPGKDYYYIDGISWHRYTGGDLAHAGLEDFRERIQACKRLVDRANDFHHRTGEDALGWGIGEFNSNAGGGGTCSFAAGQMFAGIYMDCMENGAAYAANWSVKEGGSSCSGTDFGFLNADNSPRSTAAHMQMIALNMSGDYVSGKSGDEEVLVYGSKNASTICAMLINRSDESKKYTLKLNEGPVSPHELTLAINAGIDREYSNRINGNESQLIVFSNAGVPSEKWTYNSTMDGQWATREQLSE
jgi:hypothetical protein